MRIVCILSWCVSPSEPFKTAGVMLALPPCLPLDRTTENMRRYEDECRMQWDEDECRMQWVQNGLCFGPHAYSSQELLIIFLLNRTDIFF